MPSLPGKAMSRLLPFRNDDGIFDPSFIEDRRKGLEIFVNKVAGHPLAQNEKLRGRYLPFYLEFEGLFEKKINNKVVDKDI